LDTLLESAIEDASRSIVLNNANAFAYVRRGKVLSDKRDYVSAICDFDRAIHLNPKHGGAFQCRAKAWLALGEHERALKDFEEAKKFGSGSCFL